MFLSHLKRNARASMAIRQWLKFPSKEVPCRDARPASLVAIHQHVLKPTTSAGLVALVYLVCFVCLVEQD
jgi:hypothetical protein